MNIYIIYGIISFIWALFAIYKQISLPEHRSNMWPLTFILNFLGMPIAFCFLLYDFIRK